MNRVDERNLSKKLPDGRLHGAACLWPDDGSPDKDEGETCGTQNRVCVKQIENKFPSELSAVQTV